MPFTLSFVLFGIARTAPKIIQSAAARLAKELIQAGQMSISRVSYECGYDNYSYFTKLFKKKYGVTPREYSQNVEK